MPAWYEVIYETGEHSVMFAQDDEEALEGIKEQHKRATEGRLGGADGTQWPATRVKRVLVYNEHPGSLYESGLVPVAVFDEYVAEAKKANQMGDLVNAPVAIKMMRNSLSALHRESAPHESNFRMKEARELKEASWQS